MFNVFEAGDKVRINRAGMKPAEGYIARISAMGNFTIFHVEINGRLYVVYDPRDLVLIP